ncbi:hypothetical protein Dimus_034744, partial [Dionaea muscipula]
LHEIMEITGVEVSSTATSPSPASSQSSMPPSIPSSRKRKSTTTKSKTNDPKEKPPIALYSSLVIVDMQHGAMMEPCTVDC